MNPLTQIAILCVALAASASSLACEHCDSQASVPAAMAVVRDAETGALRAPTPEELAALQAKAKPTAAAKTAVAASAARSAAKAPSAPVVYGSGARSAKLPSGLSSFSVATRAADGSVKTDCIEGAESASEALRSAAQSLPAPTIKRETE